MEPVVNKPFLSPRLYDFLKNLVQLILTPLGTLYFTLAMIWGLPAAEEVVGTVGALVTFGTITLRLSKASYNNSDLRYVGETWVNYTEDGPKRVFNVTADTIDPDKKTLEFKVLESSA
jgi:hypothetical protein